MSPRSTCCSACRRWRASEVPHYGAFSKRSLDELLAGARVDVAPYKRDPMDFVLWKPSGPQDPAWPSPAGIATPGRPGWHIECSAMAWRHLVKAFETRLDLRRPGGARDLRHPWRRHRSRLSAPRERDRPDPAAPSTSPRMANVWMHNGFLQVEGEKMSKSLGNFVTIHELLAGLAGRGLALQHAAHALPPADRLDVRGLEESREDARPLVWLAGDGEAAGLSPPSSRRWRTISTRRRCSPELHALDGAGRRTMSSAPICARSASWPRSAERLEASPAGGARGRSGQVDALIAARMAARAAKNWAESDRIRDELVASASW